MFQVGEKGSGRERVKGKRVGEGGKRGGKGRRKRKEKGKYFYTLQYDIIM